MAVPFRALGRLLRLSGSPTVINALILNGIITLTAALSRSAFTARKNDPRNPNWMEVGLVLSSTIAIWVLLFKQHNDDIREYERRKAERESQQLS